MKKAVMTILVLFTVIGFTVTLCGAASHGTQAAPAKKPVAAKKVETLKLPVITLDRVEIAGYWGYWFDAPNRRAAPLALAFIFAIENPNKAAVMLDDLKFTVAFEDFEVNTVMIYDDNYIPAMTKEFLRVNVLLDAFITNGLLAVTSGHRLLEMNVKGTDLLEKWWKGVADFDFPIEVRNGTATFEGPRDQILRVAFTGVFPPKK